MNDRAAPGGPANLVLFHVGLACAAALTLVLVGPEPLFAGFVPIVVGWAVGAALAVDLDRRGAARWNTPALTGPVLWTMAVAVGCLLNWLLHVGAPTAAEFNAWAIKPAFWLLVVGVPLATLIGGLFGAGRWIVRGVYAKA